MAPNQIKGIAESMSHDGIKLKEPYQTVILWRQVFFYIYLHTASIIGIYLIWSTKFNTIIWTLFLHISCILGITAGTHRLWSHRSYKAKWPFQLMLLIFETTAFQNGVYHWARDHRMHHKYSETDADPHNSNRGFFFSHIGWLMVKKHPELIEKGKCVDMSDLEANPLVMFQKRYYWILAPLIALIIPTFVPVYFWNETLINSWHIPAILRWCLGLHSAFVINSFSHTWGYRPYNKNIKPTDNMWLSVHNLGEGFHNYHHVFPWDYKTSEYIAPFSLTTKLINLMARIGWAYDLKTVTPNTIKLRIKKTGSSAQ